MKHKMSPRGAGPKCIMIMCPIMCARELETNYILDIKDQSLAVQGSVA